VQVDTAVARRRLEEMLGELDDSIRALRGEHPEESSELSHLDQHPADTASELADADREEAVLEVALRQRDEVRAALRRVDDGSYGACVDCGQQLPDERLDARPEAARCVRCQQRREAAR
jgi:DnaK suppressor protein